MMRDCDCAASGRPDRSDVDDRRGTRRGERRGRRGGAPQSSRRHALHPPHEARRRRLLADVASSISGRLGPSSGRDGYLFCRASGGKLSDLSLTSAAGADVWPPKSRPRSKVEEMWLRFASPRTERRQREVRETNDPPPPHTHRRFGRPGSPYAPRRTRSSSSGLCSSLFPVTGRRASRSQIRMDVPYVAPSET